MITRLLMLGGLGLCAGCAGTIPPGFSRPPGPPPEGHPHVEMRYLGNGGWLLRRGRDVMATAPFVSNPTGLRLLLPAKPRGEIIDQRIPSMPDVEIILVGHGHYDHAMDLPHIAVVQAPNASFYGGRTVSHLLAPAIEKSRLVAVDHLAAAGDLPGRWVYNAAKTLRFMPLRSTHAPQILGVKLTASGSLDRDLDELPAAPLSWPEGETLAFLIDFLGPERAVEFRIYYQDAASRPGTGIIPVLDGPDAARVDVAILCVAAFDQVPGNPEHILANVQPRHVVGGHWEDFFFRSVLKPPRPAPGTSVAAFLRRATAVSSAPVYVPEPGAGLYFRIDGRR